MENDPSVHDDFGYYVPQSPTESEGGGPPPFAGTGNLYLHSSPTTVSMSDLQLVPGDLPDHDIAGFQTPASFTPSTVLAAHAAGQTPMAAAETPDLSSPLESQPVSGLAYQQPIYPPQWSYSGSSTGSGAFFTATGADTHIQAPYHLGGNAGLGVGSEPGFGPAPFGQNFVPLVQAPTMNDYDNTLINESLSLISAFQLWPQSNGSIEWNDLSPQNSDLKKLLLNYKQLLIYARHPQANRVLTAEQISLQLANPENPRHHITADKLDGYRCDIQGIDWTKLGVTRGAMRAHRTVTFTNYVNISRSDSWDPGAWERVPNTHVNYLDFRRMRVKKKMFLPHHQLRNLVACSSRTRVYYADRGGIVQEFNMLTGLCRPVLRFKAQGGTSLSTIASGQNMLVGGSIDGKYCVTKLDSGCPYGKPTEGFFPGTNIFAGVGGPTSDIANHIEVHSLRTTGPLAAFSSNDYGLRILDLETQKLLSTALFDFAPNCSAISPDRRLRVVVGDQCDALIVPAEPERATDSVGGGTAPDILQVLSGHKDHGFACAWAPDGYTLATGNQDRRIKIWDARKWSSAVTTIRTQMSGARSLHFTPAGSGSRLLIVGEEADYVTAVDALSFRSQQTIDMFGELGGVALTDDGQDLFVLCADPWRGGIAHFTRPSTFADIVDDYHLEDAFAPYQRRQLPGYRHGPPDWIPIGAGRHPRRLR